MPYTKNIHNLFQDLCQSKYKLRLFSKRTHGISKILFNLGSCKFLARQESKIRKCLFFDVHYCKNTVWSVLLICQNLGGPPALSGPTALWYDSRGELYLSKDDHCNQQNFAWQTNAHMNCSATMLKGGWEGGGAQCVELKLRWQFCVHTSTCHEIYF